MHWGSFETPSHRRTGVIHQRNPLVNGISAHILLETPDFAGIFTVVVQPKFATMLGGTIATSNEAAMVGGPIEARDFDEIVDFHSCALDRAALLPTMRLTGTPLWTAIFLDRADAAARIAVRRLGKFAVHRVTFG